jgi:transcriptional regulator with XRE-family HTH domain
MSNFKRSTDVEWARLAKALGRRIAKQRGIGDISQHELGRRTGISRSSIANYETGVNLPSAMHLLRLARMLRVTTDYLLGKEVGDGN